MAHPLSKSLVNQKFLGISIILFLIGFGIYAVFLGIYTTIVLRTQHPQYYYNLTGFDFDSNLCRNVTQALTNKNIALKQTSDYIFPNSYICSFGIIVLKNAWVIISYIRVDRMKNILHFLFELISLAFGFYFIYDSDYQTKVTMRCPAQWEIGACGSIYWFI